MKFSGITKGVVTVIRWSLLAEFFSIFILGIIFVRYYCYERKVVFTPKRRLFLHCLLSSAASILLNILCVYTLSRPDQVPLWVNMALNTLYFLLTAVMCSLFAYFLLVLILEHVYDPRCLRTARRQMCIRDRSTSGSLPPPTKIWRTWCGQENSVRICITASMYCS